MNLGFVGTGPWAQKLAAAFRECGAEIAGHTRKSGEARDDFGARYDDWQNMIEAPNIDALILCAPPDVTTEAALACAKAGKRCVATKPLMWTEVPDVSGQSLPEEVPSDDSMWVEHAQTLKRWRDHFCTLMQLELPTNLYVDLWRLYSPAWIALKEELRGTTIEQVSVTFAGNGPFRSFSGVLDWGPHALAFAMDLLGTDVSDLSILRHRGADGRGQMCAIDMTLGGALVSIATGNESRDPGRFVEVNGGEYYWVEEAGADQYYMQGYQDIMSCDPLLALRRFCRAFLAGEPSSTLRLSVAGMKILKKATEHG